MNWNYIRKNSINDAHKRLNLHIIYIFTLFPDWTPCPSKSVRCRFEACPSNAILKIPTAPVETVEWQNPRSLLDCSIHITRPFIRNTVRNSSEIHWKSENFRNVSQIQPSLPRSQSLKYYKNQNKHTYFFLYYLYLSHIYPKFKLLSLYFTYSNTVKIPNASEMHQKSIRNLSQIQPSLPRSQSLKYYKNQNKHTYFFLYYLYLSHIYPKFNLLTLYLTYSNTVKIPNASEMHQKSIRNLSQIQPSLPTSQSLKYYKNQNKHTYFFLYYLYLSHIYPKFNLLTLYLIYSNTVKIPNASEMHQKCIRNVSEIYPKFNLLSLHLSHSNTIKIKTSIHISFYITYIYPTFIPNSTFSPYISLTQIL